MFSLSLGLQVMQNFENDYPAINKALLAFRRKNKTCNSSPKLQTVVLQIFESENGKGASQSYLRDCIAKRKHLSRVVSSMKVQYDIIQNI